MKTFSLPKQIFVMTNFVETRQTQSTCHEVSLWFTTQKKAFYNNFPKKDYTDNFFDCETDDDCVNKTNLNNNWNGKIKLELRK